MFYAAGGHGTVKDFLTASGLHSLAAQIYAQGGVVAAVCHGPVVLPGVKDADGHSIVKGKTVAGFTDAGEEAMGLTQYLKDNNYVFVSTELKNAGGNFVEPKGPWDDFSVVDGKLASEKKKPVFFPLG